jgi:hypothetical protein
MLPHLALRRVAVGRLLRRTRALRVVLFDGDGCEVVDEPEEGCVCSNVSAWIIFIDPTRLTPDVPDGLTCRPARPADPPELPDLPSTRTCL